MKFQERAEVILKLLEERQIIKAEELSEEFGISLVTVRKDLQRLEDEGRLIRTFGGAAPCRGDVREPQRLAAMQAIAGRVTEEIHDGDCIIMTAGNTTLLTARRLLRLGRLKVITNSISIARELSGKKGFQVILLGGEMTADAVFTHGGEAIRQLEQYKADKLILSVSGISCQRGITTRHMEAADLFRKMIARSEQVIVTADETKIGFESFYYVDSLEAVDQVVTNVSPGSEAELQQMERMGILVSR